MISTKQRISHYTAFLQRKNIQLHATNMYSAQQR